MRRVFKCDLSQKGIQQLIKDLKNYRDVILPNKCRQLVTRLAEIGIQTAKVHISESPLGHYVTIRTEIEPSAIGCRAILIATGATKTSDGYGNFNTLLAIEFGAGIHYNSTPNPKANDLGFGVGTFPGQLHAFQEEGWFYWDENSQSWKHAYGVKATMPMYKAGEKIIRNIRKIAREVFSS